MSFASRLRRDRPRDATTSKFGYRTTYICASSTLGAPPDRPLFLGIRTTDMRTSPVGPRPLRGFFNYGLTTTPMLREKLRFEIPSGRHQVYVIYNDPGCSSLPPKLPTRIPGLSTRGPWQWSCISRHLTRLVPHDKLVATCDLPRWTFATRINLETWAFTALYRSSH
jgi:hypothetical protein